MEIFTVFQIQIRIRMDPGFFADPDPGFKGPDPDLSIRAGRAFLDSRSRVPGVLGTRARGNAIFFKARGNAEWEEVGTLISRA